MAQANPTFRFRTSTTSLPEMGSVPYVNTPCKGVKKTTDHTARDQFDACEKGADTPAVAARGKHICS